MISEVEWKLWDSSSLQHICFQSHETARICFWQGDIDKDWSEEKKIKLFHSLRFIATIELQGGKNPNINKKYQNYWEKAKSKREASNNMLLFLNA